MNYESIVGSAARLIRRRWYLFVLGPIVGVLLVFALQRSSSYRAEQVIRVDELENVGAILGAEEVPEVDINRLTQQAQIDFDRGDHDSDVSATYVANLTARTVTLTVVAPTAEKADEQLAALASTFSDLVTEPLVAQLDVGIANADSSLDDLSASMEQARETLADSGGDAATTAVIAGSLRDTNDQIVETSQRRQMLVGLRDFIADDLVTFGSADITAPGTGKTVLAAGGIAGLVVACGVAVALVLLDRTVRRTVHIERCAPEAVPLGAMGRPSAAGLPPGIAAAIDTFARNSAARRLVVVGVGRQSEAESFASTVAAHVDAPVVAAARQEEAISNAEPGDGFVVTIPWGRASEDAVSATVTMFLRGGAGPVAAVLTHVPSNELDWAASRRSLTGPPTPVADTLPA